MQNEITMENISIITYIQKLENTVSTLTRDKLVTETNFEVQQKINEENIKKIEALNDTVKIKDEEIKLLNEENNNIKKDLRDKDNAYKSVFDQYTDLKQKFTHLELLYARSN